MRVTSSLALAVGKSSKGYLSWGKGAIGQSKLGTSSLWIGLLCVVESAPMVRPWNAPSKDRIERFGDPGACKGTSLQGRIKTQGVKKFSV